MSVAHEFRSHHVKYSPTDKRVYLLDEYRSAKLFNYDIMCRVPECPITIFFDTKQKKMMVVSKDVSGFVCVLLGFWVENDVPVSACNWFANQKEMMKDVAEDFRLQYASLLVDELINE